MSGDTLHIVFTLSARVSLEHGLKLANKPDRVIGLGDDLSFGPISKPEITARREFIYDVLNYDFGDGHFDNIDAFWKKALDDSQERIVWFSQWSTMEYCGFLEWLHRNNGQPFKVVDLSHTKIPKQNASNRLVPIEKVSLVREDAFCDNALWSLASLPTGEETLKWTALWQRLKSENAPLRTINESGLVSAPLGHFDNSLLKHISNEAVRANRVVGNTLADMMFDSFREGGVYQCGDLVLFSRLRTLAEQGVLEAEGDVWGSQFLVRRP